MVVKVLYVRNKYLLPSQLRVIMLRKMSYHINRRNAIMKSRKNDNILGVATVAVCMVTLLLAGCSSLAENKAKRYFADLYKRMPYRQEGKHRVISIFYTTSRKVVDTPGKDLKFLPKMGDALTGGIIDVKIDPSIRIGRMLPKRFESKGEIGLKKIDKVDIDSLADKIRAAIDTSPHKSLLVLVFGFKDDFYSVAIEAAYYSYMLDVNTPILLFDWPGDQPVSISGYKQAQKNAKESGAYFGEVLATIAKEIQPGDKIWIQASSLGCQVVCSGFEYMHEHPILADPQEEIDHVFLAAPDIAQEEFDEKFKEEIAALSKSVTTYVSFNDSALLMSSILNDDERLGRQTLKGKTGHDQLYETKGMLYLKSQNPDKIALVDVTPINKASYGHGYYLEDPHYFDDVYLRMFTDPPHRNRRLYLVEYEDGTDYWVLKE